MKTGMKLQDPVDKQGHRRGLRAVLLMCGWLVSAGLFAYTLTATCAAPVQSVTSEPVEVLVVEMPAEVPPSTFILKKINGGLDILMNWNDVSGAESYPVFSDSNPAGSFANEVGTAVSGVSGLTVSMPGASIVYYLVAGANDTCGVGPLR